ncbi:MAG: YqcC family protein [Moraxellaceae bacterium]|nr:YqcC family protein [Moraxellaceae bacterium]
MTDTLPLSERHRQMAELLIALEKEMQRQQLWSAAPPSPEAMASVMPFMYDTLAFHQWLQWVFIPRTRALMEAGRTLPGNCHIHPLAEHELARQPMASSAALLEVILRIDTVMNLP